MSKRKVCVVLVDRANYGRLKPVMHALQVRPELELQVVAAGTMVLERFDQPVNVVRNDGFTINGEIFIELEGSTPATMAKAKSVRRIVIILIRVIRVIRGLLAAAAAACGL